MGYGEDFINSFFNDLSSWTEDRNPDGRMKIIGRVRNGKSWLWHDQDSNTFWRTLKSAKTLSPTTQRVKKPRNLDGVCVIVDDTV